MIDNHHKNNIYADHSATTPLLPEALEAMLPYLKEDFGNPSSPYGRGVKTHHAVEDARNVIADCIHARQNEIFFTSGGTESDNWALNGVAKTLKDKGKHIIVSSIEHHAVLNTCAALEAEGYEVTFLPVDANGKVALSDLEMSIREDTVLISIMLANNEIGTIQDIKAMAAVAHDHGVLFHTDAVQAVGHIPVNVKRLGVDLMSASAHKFNGPQGCGFLYVKHGTPIQPFHYGGQQEAELRAGTENVAGIVGMATALQYHIRNMHESEKRLKEMAKTFKDIVSDNTPKAIFNGDNRKRLLGHVSVSFPGRDGEALLHLLDLKGICVSTGAACNSRSAEVSHVLRAIGLPYDVAKGTLRVTFGHGNTIHDAENIANTLIAILKKI